MEKFIPREKMGKKARKEHDSKMRSVWEIRPVTKLKDSKKAYNRKKIRREFDSYGESFLFFPHKGQIKPHIVNHIIRVA